MSLPRRANAPARPRLFFTRVSFHLRPVGGRCYLPTARREKSGPLTAPWLQLLATDLLSMAADIQPVDTCERRGSAAVRGALRSSCYCASMLRVLLFVQLIQLGGCSVSQHTELPPEAQLQTNLMHPDFRSVRPILARLDTGRGLGLSHTGVAACQRFRAYLHQEGRAAPPFEERMPLLRRAVAALRAPPLIYSWVDTLSSNFSSKSPTVELGVSLSSTGLVASLHVRAERAGQMPNLPASNYWSVRDLLPEVRNTTRGDLISIEWQPGEPNLALSHHAAHTNLTYAQTVREWGEQADDEKLAGKAETILSVIPLPGSARLVQRSDPYRSSEARMPPIRRAQSLSLSLRAGESAMDALRLLLLDPLALVTWSWTQTATLATEPVHLLHFDAETFDVALDLLPKRRGRDRRLQSNMVAGYRQAAESQWAGRPTYGRGGRRLSETGFGGGNSGGRGRGRSQMGGDSVTNGR